jgi:hypothetical protein
VTIGLYDEQLIPLDRDHMTLCQFETPDNGQYSRVLTKLKKVVVALLK